MWWFWVVLLMSNFLVRYFVKLDLCICVHRFWIWVVVRNLMVFECSVSKRSVFKFHECGLFLLHWESIFSSFWPRHFVKHLSADWNFMDILSGENWFSLWLWILSKGLEYEVEFHVFSVRTFGILENQFCTSNLSLVEVFC